MVKFLYIPVYCVSFIIQFWSMFVDYTNWNYNESFTTRKVWWGKILVGKGERSGASGSKTDFCGR